MCKCMYIDIYGYGGRTTQSQEYTYDTILANDKIRTEENENFYFMINIFFDIRDM